MEFGFLINFPQPGVKSARTEIDLQIVYLDNSINQSDGLSVDKILDLKSINIDK